ncbi:hypothetical protein PN466_03065 [Roseofilum reptotaenium CS-1145]|uniref:Uncharacterized protein n=1 Tax=Roseofilum reptotaenium AO1-A TaxID=1925591 RepID=A0A1L9QJY4_9CYAN|nr:hypothetical protein [Roseofilum reptotaenium]MDB9515940.1 hypothetical protein [Roseofilum reptotaenium CS-1145]OJJ15248.1 hypothetical protein BI308_24415 [Roseofilum reptotaenium AO1-A]
MSEPNNTLSPVESVLLKSFSLIGVLVFAGVMVGRWNHLITQVALAETEVSEVVAPEPEVTATPEVEEVIVASASPTGVTTSAVMTETVETEVVEDVAETLEVEMDEATVSALRSELYEQIDSNWQTSPTFSESLVYQVEVNEEGAIANYTPLNSLASDYLTETPLETLVQEEDSSSSAPFLVVMAPSGVLEVSSWTGQ